MKESETNAPMSIAPDAAARAINEGSKEERFLAVNAATKFTKTYEALCKQFCREVGFTQTALDVLIFLANNPKLNNACDIVANLGFKPTHISASVDRLVELGFVRREPAPGDRRRFSLVVTEEAAPIVERGRAIRHDFYRQITKGISPDDIAAFNRIVRQVSQNIDDIEKAAKKRGSKQTDGKCS